MNENHRSAPMIQTHGLTKRYGSRTAVADVDLAVPRACAYGFLGHNGAGKTTVIRMLLGLTHADAGTMHILGRPVPAERGQALSRVGAIVEEPSFHRYLTGRENLRVAAAVRGDGAMTRIPAVLRRVGLADRADEKVRAYSQGMRQRLGVARCLLADPELLVLDEPMNGLDPGGILELRHMIRSLVDEGRTVFLSSHLLDEVEKTCDAAAVIDHGRILEAGPIGTLLRRGAAAEIEIDCDQPERALDLLAGHPAVTAVAAGGDGIRVTLVIDDGAAAVNTALVQAGVSVSRLEPVRHSLEERFLGLTSTLEGQS